MTPAALRTARWRTEEAEHLALMQWVALHTPRYPALAYLYHIPNGGLRHTRTAGRLKALGVAPGYPDLGLDVARRCGECRHYEDGGWCREHSGAFGLRLELKVPGGAVRADQRAWHQWLTQQGYCMRVCVGWEAARDVLVWYLEDGNGASA